MGKILAIEWSFYVIRLSAYKLIKTAGCLNDEGTFCQGFKLHRNLFYSTHDNNIWRSFMQKPHCQQAHDVII